MARTKEDATKAAADGTPVGRRGRSSLSGTPSGGVSKASAASTTDKPKPAYVPSGRPRGRPKGSTKKKEADGTPIYQAATRVPGRGRGRPRKTDTAGAATGTKSTTPSKKTPTKGTPGKRGRPSKKDIAAAAAARALEEEGQGEEEDDEEAEADADVEAKDEPAQDASDAEDGLDDGGVERRGDSVDEEGSEIEN